MKPGDLVSVRTLDMCGTFGEVNIAYGTLGIVAETLKMQHDDSYECCIMFVDGNELNLIGNGIDDDSEFLLVQEIMQ